MLRLVKLLWYGDYLGVYGEYLDNEMEVRRLQAEISRLRAALHQIICMDENEHTLAQSQTIAKAALRSNPRG